MVFGNVLNVFFLLDGLCCVVFFPGNLQSRDRVSISCFSIERQFISCVSDVFTKTACDI